MFWKSQLTSLISKIFERVFFRKITQDSIYSLEFIIIYLILNPRPRYFVLLHQIISDFEERTLNALKKV